MLALIADLHGRLRARPDSEHVQPLLRALGGTAAALYALSTDTNADLGYGFDQATQVCICLVGGFLTGGLGFFVHIVFFPDANPLRRCTGLFHDMAWCGLALYAFGDKGILIWGMYIWLVIGYGFRYGIHYLYAATVAALLSFYAVAYFSPYYRNNYEIMALGTFLLALVIPVYLGSMLKSLHRNLEAARQADRLKTRFLANVSHDLRTPLHVILSNCETLERDLPEARQQLSPLLDIREAATTLRGLVIDLLDVAKLEAGRLQLDSADFNLVVLLGRVMRLNEVTARQQNTRITLTVDPSTPVQVCGDRLKLEQILNNIVSNAVKYTENGVVHINARAEQENTPGADKRFVCSIHDTGIGMEAGAAERIFARFEQADEAYARSYSGAGLGLSIAGELVNLMNGSIEVNSAKGRGSCFTVSLPVRPRDESGYERDAPFLAEPLLVICAPEREAHWRKFASHNRPSEVTVHGIPPKAAEPLRLAFPFSGKGYVLVDARGIEDQLRELSRFLCATSDSESLTYLLVNAPGRHTDWRAYRAYRSFSGSDSAGCVRQMLAIAQWSSRSQQAEIPNAEDGQAHADILRGQYVLVADDNELNRRVIGNVLSRAGARIFEARNGREALAMLSSASVGVAILDVQMPDLTGVDVMRASVAQGEERSIPFIALTADTTDECRSQCLAAGAASVLYKPVSANSLYRELHRVMSSADGPLDSRLPSNVSVERRQAPLDYALLQKLALSAQRPDYMTTLVACFKKDGGRLLQELGEVFQSGDMGSGRALLHRLNGMSSAIGADAIAKLCGRTLASSDTSLRASSRALVNQLTRLHDEAAEALEKFVSATLPTSAASPSQAHR